MLLPSWANHKQTLGLSYGNRSKIFFKFSFSDWLGGGFSLPVKRGKNRAYLFRVVAAEQRENSFGPNCIHRSCAAAACGPPPSAFHNERRTPPVDGRLRMLRRKTSKFVSTYHITHIHAISTSYFIRTFWFFLLVALLSELGWQIPHIIRLHPLLGRGCWWPLGLCTSHQWQQSNFPEKHGDLNEAHYKLRRSKAEKKLVETTMCVDLLNYCAKQETLQTKLGREAPSCAIFDCHDYCGNGAPRRGVFSSSAVWDRSHVRPKNWKFERKFVWMKCKQRLVLSVSLPPEDPVTFFLPFSPGQNSPYSLSLVAHELEKITSDLELRTNSRTPARNWKPSPRA